MEIANPTKSFNLLKYPPMENPFNLTKEQKLACVTFLGKIVNSSIRTNSDLYKLYTRIERKQYDSMGLSMAEVIDYIEFSQQKRDLYIDSLTSLNDRQKDFLVSLAMELLWCNGTPSEEEYIKFEKSFEKVALISKEEFSQRILKINNLLNHFS